MENINRNTQFPVVLVKSCKLCRDTCGECAFIDLSRQNSSGEYYCPYMHRGSFRSYVGATETACRHFRQA